MFKLQSLSKHSPFNTIHLLRHFFHCLKQFWTHQFWYLLLLLLFFASPLPHQQNVSLWGCFSSGETKTKSWLSEIGWIQRMRHRGHVVFVKPAEHSLWCGQVHLWITHHEMGKHVVRALKKNLLNPNPASHNNTCWCTDTHELWDHSPSGRSLCYKGPMLQKIILVFWQAPIFSRVIVEVFLLFFSQ